MIKTGYFTSRSSIVDWINDTLLTNVTKLEQLGSGNIYCQLLDAAYPEKVPLSKIKWQAYLEVDFLHNFKILQSSFEKLGIKKTFDAQRLAKAKYQDNLEFVQWFKWQFEEKISENKMYNALERRNQQKINLLFAGQKNFDLRQTMTKENKENMVKKPTKMIYSMGSKKEQPKSTILQPNKSVLGLKSMNVNYQENTSLLKKVEPFKKCPIDKQNIQIPSISSGESKLKKKKLTITSKSTLSKPIIFKAVEVIQSDDQECF